MLMLWLSIPKHKSSRHSSLLVLKRIIFPIDSSLVKTSLYKSNKSFLDELLLILLVTSRSVFSFSLPSWRRFFMFLEDFIFLIFT